jgi:DNA (cytosine-5)-methyltransferase 1
MSWYVKTKRAQSSIDDEKWVEGAVHPTLNAFDVGDTRAVVLVIEDVEEMVHCLGGHHPNASITEDVCCTLTSAMGLGGGHIPLVAVSEEEMQTYPIQGTVIGRKDTAGPQGKGYGDSSDPMFTLDTTGGHAVAMTEDDGTIVFHPHRTDGFRIQGETINTLTAFMGTGGLNTPMVAKPGVTAYDEYNDSISETHHTLRAGTKQSTGAVVGSAVRRLTPVECERLQGFPDGWTDDQADSHRYKQMGNAVTVNVIAWIGSRVG